MNMEAKEGKRKNNFHASLFFLLAFAFTAAHQTKNFLSLLIEFGMPNSDPKISSHFSKTIPATTIMKSWK